MLGILLGIIKIILYIILIIVLFILSLIMIILFVPIRYKVDCEKYDELKLDIKINWLLHIISFKYFIDDEQTMKLKIFGKDILNKKDKKEKKHKKHRKKKNNNDSKPLNGNNNIKQVKEDITKEDIAKQDNQHTINKKIEVNYKIDDNNIEENKIKDSKTKENQENINNEVNKVRKENQEINKTKPPKKIKTKKRKKSKLKKKKAKKSKEKAKDTSKWKKILSDIIEFIKNDDNKAVIKKVKNIIVKMIKHILPKKFKSKVVVGTGDPASTGYIVGATSILYTVTKDKFVIIPNFNEKILQGCFYGKGRIYLIVLVKNTLSIILDKRIRKLYKMYKDN
ncbi:MAG: DUF2953 domain-containing protein [Vallitalea sp.]|jgi:hypothetical protein|nr:DUF2953 domain-containing protein [Vallitalea sp.]